MAGQVLEAYMLDQRADLREVPELFRHANVATTARYTHVSVERLKVTVRTALPLW